MDISYNCEYCKKSYSTKSALNFHQKTAKVCLRIRGLANESFTCEGCEHIFANKHRLDLHVPTCRENDIKTLYESRLSEQSAIHKSQLSELTTIHESQAAIQAARFKRELIDQAAKFTDDINNLRFDCSELGRDHADECQKLKLEIDVLTRKNVCLEEQNEALRNILPLRNEISLTPERTVVRDISVFLSNKELEDKFNQHFTCEYMLPEPGKSLAKFIKLHIATGTDGIPIYSCTDTGRYVFKYINKDGGTLKDVKANKLLTEVYPILCNRLKCIRKTAEEKISELEKQIRRERDDYQIALYKKEIGIQTRYCDGVVRFYNIMPFFFGPKIVKELATSLC